MLPRLPALLRSAAEAWHEADPLNAGRRPRDVFKTFVDLARVARLIERGALEPTRFGRYRLSDWAIADILNPPPTSSPPTDPGSAA